jgi:hypothetical protein
MEKKFSVCSRDRKINNILRSTWSIKGYEYSLLELELAYFDRVVLRVGWIVLSSRFLAS